MQYRKDRHGEKLSALGYGCMRFTRKGAGIDLAKAEKEILLAVKGGVNYFDTAYIYPGSEEALGEILYRNGLRDKVNIATKLPQYLIKNRAAIDRYFDEELSRLKTDHIDYYLMHMLTDVEAWNKLVALGIETWIEEKKKCGQIRNIGFSFHGNTDIFLKILEAYDWDFCQIQYNYMDEVSQAGKAGLQAAAAKGIPVIIMEPLRGGKLVNMLPEKARELIRERMETAEVIIPGSKQEIQGKHSGQAAGQMETPEKAGSVQGQEVPVKSDTLAGKRGSRDVKEQDSEIISAAAARLALRWLYDQKEVTVVLSGMNSRKMVKENCITASRSLPGCLSDEERSLIADIRAIISEKIKVPCTGCRYCMPCPQGVDIPGTFRCYNEMYTEKKGTGRREFYQVIGLRKDPALPSQCVACGRCEKHCPQHIAIIEELKKANRELLPLPYRAAVRVARVFMFGLKIK